MTQAALSSSPPTLLSLMDRNTGEEKKGGVLIVSFFAAGKLD